MQEFKRKLYEFEEQPPKEIWDNIRKELNDDEQKFIKLPVFRKRSKIILYSLTAAAALIVMFISSFLFNRQSRKNSESKPTESPTALNSATPNQAILDSFALNNKILEDIINTKNDKNLIALNYENSFHKKKKYITVEGPQGLPVRISPKVATLIESADNEYPPKPVWDKKIEKWKKIMLSSTISPSSADLLDIVALSPPIDSSE